MQSPEIRDRIKEIRRVSGRELRANEKNWRVHPVVQQRGMRGVLQTLGAADVLKAYIASDGVLTLLDGHLRSNLAPDFMWTVAVLDFDETEALTFLMTYDPLAGMAEADTQILQAAMETIKTENQDMLELLGGIAEQYGVQFGVAAGKPVPIISPELADSLQERWQVQKGDVWDISSDLLRGNHRLVCGDCTDPDVVDLSLDGRQAAICWTDPPYNVELGTGGNYAKFSGRTVANDNLRDKFPEFVAGFCAQIERALQPGAVLYMTMGSQEWPTVDGLLRDAGFHWSSTIIWVKQQFVLARKDYHTQFEPMWYGWKTGDGDEAVDLDVPGAVEEYLRHYAQGYDAMWYGWKRGAARLQKVKDRKQGDVWFFDRPTSSPEHPTMKPLELVERSLENSSRPGDLVFDPFGGSGTTMCVAERLGRLCSMVELLPKYCAVVLERMTLMGCRPVRVSQEVQE